MQMFKSNLTIDKWKAKEKKKCSYSSKWMTWFKNWLILLILIWLRVSPIN